MIQRLTAFLAIFLVSCLTAVAQDDAALLRSYLGIYEGRGVAIYEAGGHEEVSCRLSFDSGSAGKIILRDSFCQVSGTNIRFTGTMAYLGGQYEAAVTSNVGFNARTIGRREGNAIVFVLQDAALADRTLGLSATFVMTDGGVVVDMDLVSNRTGAVTKVRVPMVRR